MWRAVRAWLRRLARGSTCERCGAPGAKLVIEAVPAGKRIDGKTGMRVKSYTVTTADWLCPGCRNQRPNPLANPQPDASSNPSP